jgi:hypothetical protein
MRDDEPSGIIYRTHDNSAPASTPATEEEQPTDDEIHGALCSALEAIGSNIDGLFAANERRAKENAELRREVDQLTGRVDALLALFSSKGDVVTLQPGRKAHG